MFNLGENVLHQKTGQIGEVIGYGHQILDGSYMTTVKVLVNHAENSGKRGVIKEDIYSMWQCQPLDQHSTRYELVNA